MFLFYGETMATVIYHGVQQIYRAYTYFAQNKHTDMMNKRKRTLWMCIIDGEVISLLCHPKATISFEETVIPGKVEEFAAHCYELYRRTVYFSCTLIRG